MHNDIFFHIDIMMIQTILCWIYRFIIIGYEKKDWVLPKDINSGTHPKKDTFRKNMGQDNIIFASFSSNNKQKKRSLYHNFATHFWTKKKDLLVINKFGHP